MATTTFSVRLPDDLRDALEAEAKKRGMTLADVIRRRLTVAESVGTNIDAISAMIEVQGRLIRSSLDSLAKVVTNQAEKGGNAQSVSHSGAAQYGYFSSAFAAALVKRIVARQGDPLSWPVQARAEAISHLERCGVPTEGL